MKIVKAKLEHRNIITNLIRNSDLGEIYFKEKNLLSIVEKAIDTSTVYVAITDDIVGFIWSDDYGVFDKYPYLHMVIVDEKHRSKGYGEQLLAFFEKELYGNQNKLFMMVGEYNPRAKSLYETVGYKEVGRLPSFYKDGIHEILMMKEK